MHRVDTFAGSYTNVECLGTPSTALLNYVGPNVKKFTELARLYGARLEDIDEVLKGEEEVDKVDFRSMSINRKHVLRAQIAQMQAELTELEQFPEDNFEVGTCVLFDKQFSDTSQVFSYAAIKGTGTMWYLSGLIFSLLNTPVDRNGARHRVNWEALTYLMREATNVRVVFKTDGHSLFTGEPVSPPEAPAYAPAVPKYTSGTATEWESEPEVRTPVRDPNRS